jgi:hypothetical protein
MYGAIVEHARFEKEMRVMRVLCWIFGFDNFDHIAVRIVGVTLVFTWLLVGLWSAAEWLYGRLAQ